MTITVSEEDSLLFEQNGFSYDDVSDTVQHYRESGFSDDEIQNKINIRLNEFRTIPQNSRALENTNKLDSDDPYVKTKEYQQEQLAHILFTPDELEEIDSQGKMGWVEYRTRFVTPKDYVPGGMLKQGYDSARLLNISKKIENNEEVSDNDKNFMYSELRKQVEISRRGLNWGAQATSMFVQAPAFIIEFAATGGIGKAAAYGAIKAGGAAATKAAIKAGTKFAASKIGAMALGREATEKVGTKYALNVSAKIAGRTIASGAILTPAYAYEKYGEMRIADGLKTTDKGEIIFSEQKDKQLKTAIRAVGVAGIQVGSESTGGIITSGIGKIANKVASTSTARGISAVSAKVYNQLPKTTRIKLEAAAKVAEKLTGEKAKAIGFHGVFGEMSEERAADILEVAFDLDSEQGYSTDQWLEAFYPGHEELLLEAGLFSVLGSVSIASRTVYKDLRQKGYNHQEAQNIVDNLSENEKENIANEILGEVSINEDITESEVNAEAARIENKIQNEAINENIKFKEYADKINENKNDIKKKEDSYKTYVNDLNGNKVEIKYNPAIKGRGKDIIQSVEITKPKLQNFSKKTSETKAQIKKVLFGDNKSLSIKNTFNSAIAKLSKLNVTKMISTAMKESENTSKELKLTPEEREQLYNDNKEIIANADVLFEKAIPILEHKDLKGIDRTITRYALPVSISNRNYNVMFTVKNNNVEEIGILYDIKTKNNTSGNLQPKLPITGANISINDLIEFVNGNLAKYGLNTEFAETETAADKIIKGESLLGKFYTDWVNRLTPIEALEEKASERKKLSPIQRPNLLARLYSGLVGATRQQIEKNTFVMTKDGNIKITGEGFLPIINDFDTAFKNIEKNQNVRHNDLKNYLEAQRFLLDLQNRENFEATEEQKLDAIKTISDLTAKYDDSLKDFETYANRIYQYQQRILHNLVDGGNMSEETYEKILKDNPHYVPFQRIIDEEFPSAVSSKSKFSGAKSKIKAIKGSEREIKDPFESIIKNTYQIIDVSYRNRIAKSIANLQDVLPEYIEKRKPIYEVGLATVKVTYDSKLRSKLESAIKFFGGKLEYKKSLNKGKGLTLGSYSPAENKIRKRLGSQDRTLAHEFGHMLDFVFGIKSAVTKNKTIMNEISKLAEERFTSVVSLENTNKGVEFVETKAAQSDKYIAYVKSDREMIANMFDLYFTSRDYMKKTAPTAYKFIETLFKGKDFKFLKDIRPSAETAIEEIEQETWIPSKLKPGGNVIEYWEDGKRKFVEVQKPVMEAVNDLSMPELNFVEKLLTASSSILRTGATIMPDFWVRNILRDQPIAFIQTRKTRPFVDMIKGLTSLIKNDKLYQEWMSAGGSFNSYMDLSDKSMREAVKELTSPQSKLSKYIKSLGLKAIEDVSMAFEQATRIGIYAREKLDSPALLAALEAREGTLDFGRSGKYGKYVNRYIPFFNASIQGVDKIVRSFQNNPVITSIKCLTAITLPSMLMSGYYLYAAPDDDRQEYLEIPQWQKDLFWCFKAGDNWWRIPKPFEIGYVFGSLPERFMTWAFLEQKPEGKEIFESIGGFFNAVSPITDVGGFMPPILRVSVENIANYNFFTGKELYPKYLDDLEPSERKRKYTSETAQFLGKQFNISPAKIENAISGSIGSSSKYVLDAGDYIINSVKQYNGENINEKPSSLNDIPVLRSFVVREPQGYQTKSINDFFDTYKELEQKSKTYKKKMGEERYEYYTKYGQEIKAFKKMDNYYDQIREINKRIDKVYANKNLSGDEKTQRIKPLAKRISSIAFEANTWYREYTKE